MTFKIWIDADACPNPIKDIIFKAAERLRVFVVLVANKGLIPPKSAFVSCIQVPMGLDVADSFIVDELSPDDIVITADVPLAARAVEKRAVAINPRGELYSEETVSEKLSMRNFLQDMRSAGYVGGGPAPFDNRNKQKFAATFDKVLAQKIKAAQGC